MSQMPDTTQADPRTKTPNAMDWAIGIGATVGPPTVVGGIGAVLSALRKSRYGRMAGEFVSAMRGRENPWPEEAAAVSQELGVPPQPGQAMGHGAADPGRVKVHPGSVKSINQEWYTIPKDDPRRTVWKDMGYKGGPGKPSIEQAREFYSKKSARARAAGKNDLADEFDTLANVYEKLMTPWKTPIKTVYPASRSIEEPASYQAWQDWDYYTPPEPKVVPSRDPSLVAEYFDTNIGMARNRGAWEYAERLAREKPVAVARAARRAEENARRATQSPKLQEFVGDATQTPAVAEGALPEWAESYIDYDNVEPYSDVLKDVEKYMPVSEEYRMTGRGLDKKIADPAGTGKAFATGYWQPFPRFVGHRLADGTPLEEAAIRNYRNIQKAEEAATVEMSDLFIGAGLEKLDNVEKDGIRRLVGQYGRVMDDINEFYRGRAPKGFSEENAFRNLSALSRQLAGNPNAKKMLDAMQKSYADMHSDLIAMGYDLPKLQDYNPRIALSDLDEQYGASYKSRAFQTQKPFFMRMREGVGDSDIESDPITLWHRYRKTYLRKVQEHRFLSQLQTDPKLNLLADKERRLFEIRNQIFEVKEYARKFPNEPHPQYGVMTKVQEKALVKEARKILGEINAMWANPPEGYGRYTPEHPWEMGYGKNMGQYKKDGKAFNVPVRMLVPDEVAYQLKNYYPKPESGVFASHVMKPVRTLAMINTLYNPSNLMTNIGGDMFTLWMGLPNEGWGEAWQRFRYIPKALKNLTGPIMTGKVNQAYRESIRSGAVTSTYAHQMFGGGDEAMSHELADWYLDTPKPGVPVPAQQLAGVARNIQMMPQRIRGLSESYLREAARLRAVDIGKSGDELDDIVAKSTLAYGSEGSAFSKHSAASLLGKFSQWAGLADKRVWDLLRSPVSRKRAVAILVSGPAFRAWFNNRNEEVAQIERNLEPFIQDTPHLIVAGDGGYNVISWRFELTAEVAGRYGLGELPSRVIRIVGEDSTPVEKIATAAGSIPAKAGEAWTNIWPLGPAIPAIQNMFKGNYHEAMSRMIPIYRQFHAAQTTGLNRVKEGDTLPQGLAAAAKQLAGPAQSGWTAGLAGSMRPPHDERGRLVGRTRKMRSLEELEKRLANDVWEQRRRGNNAVAYEKERDLEEVRSELSRLREENEKINRNIIINP